MQVQLEIFCALVLELLITQQLLVVACAHSCTLHIINAVRLVQARLSLTRAVLNFNGLTTRCLVLLFV